MTNRQDKHSKWEKEVFSGFLNVYKRQYGIALAGEVIFGDAPDIQLKIDQKKIGIEITQGFPDSMEQKGSDLKSTDISQRDFGYYLYETLKGTIGFDDFELDIEFSRIQLIKRQYQALAQQCLHELQRSGALARLKSGEPVNVENLGQLPDQIDQLNFTTPSLLKGYVHSGGRALSPFSDKELTPILIKKHAKLKEYKSCDEYWLLIHINSSMPDAFRNTDIRLPIQTLFTSVYLYWDKSEIIPLKD